LSTSASEALNQAAEAAGTQADAHCTVGYAAPEVLLAHERHELITVDPAQDIWSLGVMVFECLTEKAAIDLFSSERAVSMARGDTAYPWEEAQVENDFIMMSSGARSSVLACLSYNPDERPTAADLLRHMDAMGGLNLEFARIKEMHVKQAAASSLRKLPVGPPETILNLTPTRKRTSPLRIPGSPPASQEPA
jgi:serine/threonine protein kinase